MNVILTVDVEQDCPPFLNTWRGIDRGLPALLDLLDRERVPATFFTTGQVARRFPSAVSAIVNRGHELGCHGDTHASFATMTPGEASAEIARATGTLRAFGPVHAFRAPYLQFPRTFLPFLVQSRYRIDSSEGRHKRPGVRVVTESGIVRIPASITSSTLRWPARLRDALLTRLADPVVLFVHPWEFVDLRGERLRFDCRFRTGDAALRCLMSAIDLLRSRGAAFSRMSDHARQ
jgi:peptidoglycan/xylan/chitin deacetylase (PgdA/CDA1 family)